MKFNILYCPHCGAPNQDGRQTCQNCGSPLPAQTPPPAQHPIPQQFVPPATIYPGYAQPPLPKKKFLLPGIISGLLVTIAVAAVVFLIPEIQTQNAARQAETQAAAALKYSAITLNQNDFPPGFEILTSEEAAARGIVDAMPNYISSVSKAEAVFKTTALLYNANTGISDYVQAWVFAPLTPEELVKFKSEIANQTMTDPDISIFEDVKTMPNASYLGDGSIGISFSVPSSTIALKGEFVQGYRGDAVFIVGSIWDPAAVRHVDALYVASRLDDQIKALQH